MLIALWRRDSAHDYDSILPRLHKSPSLWTAKSATVARSRFTWRPWMWCWKIRRVLLAGAELPAFTFWSACVYWWSWPDGTCFTRKPFTSGHDLWARTLPLIHLISICGPPVRTSPLDPVTCENNLLVRTSPLHQITHKNDQLVPTSSLTQVTSEHDLLVWTTPLKHVISIWSALANITSETLHKWTWSAITNVTSGSGCLWNRPGGTTSNSWTFHK